jgi:hypothetical protein
VLALPALALLWADQRRHRPVIVVLWLVISAGGGWVTLGLIGSWLLACRGAVPPVLVRTVGTYASGAPSMAKNR